MDIAVRQVTVTPVRAHVGDTVRVDVVIENKTDGYETIPLEIFANRKVVGRKLFTFGFSPADRIYRESFAWDTGGVIPGRIQDPGGGVRLGGFLSVRQPPGCEAGGAPRRPGRAVSRRGDVGRKRDGDGSPVR